MSGLPAAVALLSAAVLLCEVALTRLFSFLLHYHYTFLVVSGAICGLGLGAVGAWFWGGEMHWRRRLGVVAFLAAASLWGAVALLGAAPRLHPLLLLMASSPPFVLAGLFLALLFRARHAQSGRLYFWDLAGAALGLVGAVPALEWLGAPGALLAGAALAALAGACAAGGRAAWALAGLCCLGLALHVRSPLLRIDLEALAAEGAKPLFRALGSGPQQGRLLETRWSAYARTDLVDRSGETGLNIYADGGAGSYMFRFAGDFRRLFFVRGEAAFFPYYFGARGRVLILGPGGGADVLYALMTGWEAVEAVEINPEIAAIVRQYGAYNGHLYRMQGVQWHVGEGRNYLQRSPRRYDLIALPLVYAEAADLAGYALQENYLFTREAFASYMDHLEPGGRLALVVHNHALLLKALSTLAALWEQRSGEAAGLLEHLVVVNGARADPLSEEAFRPLVLVQREPFTDAQRREMRAVLEEVGLEPYYLPGARQHRAVARLGEGLDSFRGQTALDLSPATDDRPFFYDVERGLDARLGWLLAASGLACLLVVGLPLLRPGLRGAAGEGRLPFSLALLAAGLGAGFMLVEIHLLQRFALFLGYPTLSLCTTLFGLLLAAGGGALAGGRLAWTGRPRELGLLAAGAGLCCLAHALLVEQVLGLVTASGPGWRVFITLVLVMPLGLLLGIFFPAVLRLGGRFSAQGVPWLWAVNGLASILGSALAVGGALLWGASAVPLLGAGAYILGGLALWGGTAREGAGAPEAGGSLGRPLLFLLLVALLWAAVFAHVARRYWRAEAPGALQPRPPVAAEVWPQALGR